MSILPILKNIVAKRFIPLFSVLFFTVIFLGMGVMHATLSVGPNPYLSYQGRLSDQNGNLLTGNYYITFCIYASSSPATACTPPTTPSQGAIGVLSGSALNSALWGDVEYFSATNSPDNHVVNGVFNAKLGSQSSFPSTLFNANSQLWLGVNIYNGSSWDGQMSPLQEIVSSGYAINAGMLSGFSASQTPGANNVVVLDGSGNLTINTGTKNIFGASAASSSQYGLVDIGTGGFGGGAGNFSGSSSGTLIALNAPSGFAGNLADLQKNGVSEFSVDNNGNTTNNYGNISVNPVVAPGSTPTLGSTAGGALGATTYYVKYTWVNVNGETNASSEVSLAVGANNLLTVTVPSFPANVTSANVYVATSSGAETKQGSIASSGGTWTEPTSGLIAGSALPATNTTGGLITARAITINTYSNLNTGLLLNNPNSASSYSPRLSFQVNGGNTRGLVSDTNFNLDILSTSGSIVDIFDNNGNITSVGNDNILSAAANAGANYGVLNIGSGGFGGAAGNFVGSSNGTELAINAPSGFTGNLIDFQAAGVSVLNLDSYGTLYNYGNLTLGSVANPTSAPTLSQTAGGALGATTYYVVYTWKNDNGQTRISPEASLAVSANNVLKVTIPSLPADASSAVIYVSNTAGGGSTHETSQAIITTTTWTEPTSGLVVGSAYDFTNRTGSHLQLDDATGNTGSIEDRYGTFYLNVSGGNSFDFLNSNGLIVLAPGSSGNNSFNSETTGGASSPLTINSTTLTVTDNDNIFSATANAGANYGVVNIGSGGFSGAAGNFSGSSSGTLLALIAVSSFGGNLFDLQANGVSMFKLDTKGNVTENNGMLTVNAVSTPAGSATLGQTAGGTIAATTYYVEYTWVNANGETQPSAEQSFAVSVNNLLTVTVPSFPTTVTSANVYVGTSSRGETKQSSIASSGGTWTEPTSGLVAGAGYPGTNGTGGIFVGGGTIGLQTTTNDNFIRPVGLLLNNATASAIYSPMIRFLVGSSTKYFLDASSASGGALELLNGSSSLVGQFLNDGSYKSTTAQSTQFTAAVSGTANNGLFNIGPGGFAGGGGGNFAGSSSGTLLALNAASGFGGNLADFQTNGSSLFKVDATGNITALGREQLFTGGTNSNANYGTVNIGSGGFGGGAGNFAGSSNGTQFAINASSGFSGNLIDAQTNGFSEAKIDATGNITLSNGNITLNKLSDASTAPTLSVTNSGGSLAAGTWFGKYTWYNANGETLASSESTQATTTGGASKITFTIPAIPSGATGAKLYMTNVNGASGTEVYQNVTITSGTTGVVSAYNAGNSAPIANTTGGNLTVTGAESMFNGPATDAGGYAYYGLLSIGNGGFSGCGGSNFCESGAGTEIAINAASGFTGNLIAAQVAGGDRFKVGGNGDLVAGTVNSTNLNGNFYTAVFNSGNVQINSISSPGAAPTLTVTNSGGSLAAGTWYGRYTWYNGAGSTAASPESVQVTTTGGASKIQFTIASIPTGAVGAHLYLTPVNGASNTEVYQNVDITSGTTGTVTAYNAGSGYPTINCAGGKLYLQSGSLAENCGGYFELAANSDVPLISTSSTTGLLVYDTNGSTGGGRVFIQPGNTTGLNEIYSTNGAQSAVQNFEITGPSSIPVLTLDAISTVFTGNDNIFQSAANAGANYGVVNIGSGGFTGGAGKFAGSSSGTLLALNAPNAFGGNLFDAQTNGTSEFKVDASGNATAAGSVTASSLVLTNASANPLGGTLIHSASSDFGAPTAISLTTTGTTTVWGTYTTSSFSKSATMRVFVSLQVSPGSGSVTGLFDLVVDGTTVQSQNVSFTTSGANYQVTMDWTSGYLAKASGTHTILLQGKAAGSNFTLNVYATSGTGGSAGTFGTQWWYL